MKRRKIYTTNKIAENTNSTGVTVSNILSIELFDVARVFGEFPPLVSIRGVSLGKLRISDCFFESSMLALLILSIADSTDLIPSLVSNEEIPFFSFIFKNST